MDRHPAPLRSPLTLRWVVALLLLVVGSAGMAPVAEADELARAQTAVVVEHQRRGARRRAEPPTRATPPTRRRRTPVLVALAARLRSLLVLDGVRRGPPRTPCVVALT